MTNQTSTTLYRRVRSLECRGAVDPAPSEEVDGVLLVGTQAVLSFYDHESSYGEDYSEVFPAFHNGKQCWMRRDTWGPARGYSASGTSEYILSFEEGVKLLIEREVFSLPPLRKTTMTPIETRLTSLQLGFPDTEGKENTSIKSLTDLHEFFKNLPDGTECDILSSDLEAGNFETAHLTLPDGSERDLNYTGPVASGYVSPFEWQGADEDMDA